jgi:hypothetical protein
VLASQLDLPELVAQMQTHERLVVTLALLRLVQQVRLQLVRLQQVLVVQPVLLQQVQV